MDPMIRMKKISVKKLLNAPLALQNVLLSPYARGKRGKSPEWIRSDGLGIFRRSVGCLYTYMYLSDIRRAGRARSMTAGVALVALLTYIHLWLFSVYFEYTECTYYQYR